MINTLRKRVLLLFFIGGMIILGLGLLFFVIRDVFIQEVRFHVMDLAISIANSIDPVDVGKIRRPSDNSTPEYKKLQSFLTKQSVRLPDIRYVYIMRRNESENAPDYQFTYVVDSATRDENGDGVIGADERCEAIGTPYNAREYPAMFIAWKYPAADEDISPDPPYPDLISGYAPIIDSNGVTQGIVGVDMTAGAIHEKMTAAILVLVAFAVILEGLSIVIVYLWDKRKKAYAKLKTLSETLEGRNKRLEELIKLRDDFGDLVVHDMRNPLTIIQYELEVYAMDKECDEEEERLFRRLGKHLGRLSELLNDMLLMAKMEAGKMVISPEPVDLVEIANQVIEELVPFAAMRNVRLEKKISSGKIVREVDRKLMFRLFENLLFNALKYTYGDTCVKVEIEELDEKRCVIRVSDHGKGIPREYWDTIFDRFGIVKAQKEGFRQVGLGLSFCKFVAEAHGGSIKVEENQPRGTVFVVDL